MSRPRLNPVWISPDLQMLSPPISRNKVSLNLLPFQDRSKKKLRSENGIGLDNLRSQLNHIYSNRARLSVEENADFFSVELQLENNK